MCTLRESKQNAFNESCCAFSNSENVQQIAKDCGIDPTMLCNKLNPSQPHKLTLGSLLNLHLVNGGNQTQIIGQLRDIVIGLNDKL